MGCHTVSLCEAEALGGGISRLTYTGKEDKQILVSIGVETGLRSLKL